MKRALTIAAGVFAGLLLAGVVAPVIIVTLPSRLRGAGVVWSATAVLVGLTTTAFWLLWVRRRGS